MDVDFGRRVCNENRREATLLVKKDKKVGNGYLRNKVWEKVRGLAVQKVTC